MELRVLTPAGWLLVAQVVDGKVVLPALPGMPASAHDDESERRVFANMPAETRIDAGIP